MGDRLSGKLDKVTQLWFDEPIKEIISEREPASIGKVYLRDLLIERKPELAVWFDDRYIAHCVTTSMYKLGYVYQSKRNKTFWRADLL